MQEEKEFIEALLNTKTREVAFRDLVSKYQKPLYHLIRTIVLNHEDTDDVLQNTFIKVFKGIENFKGQSKLYSWIYRIACNEAITFVKQKAKKQALTSESYLQKQVENLIADDYFEGGEIQIKLQKAIALLPKKQQLVFKLKYFQELTYEEISIQLGTSVGALKASYHLAVKKIEDYFNKN